jgi:hypothetical protein
MFPNVRVMMVSYGMIMKSFVSETASMIQILNKLMILQILINVSV